MLLEKVQAMLHASQLLKFLWGKAVKHGVYLKNQTSTKALNGKTPFEVYYSKKPNIANLHEFGFKVWVHNPNNSKLHSRSEIGRWVGFDEASNGHCIYWPGKCSVSIERSVTFNTDVDVFLLNSVLLEGEKLTTPRASINPKQPTVPSLPHMTLTPLPPLTTTSTIDHLGDNFEKSSPNQGHHKHICT
jgi:hypothetical protein